MTMPTQEKLQGLLDRAAIHDLHMRYFSGVDHADKETVRNCFTPDVVAQYEGRPPVRGVEALLEQIALFQNLANGTCRISTHFTGNVQFKSLTPFAAETEINAFAFLVEGDGATVAMRSLRYLDRLACVEESWKISARVHTLDWSGVAPASFARTFSRKLRGMNNWPASF